MRKNENYKYVDIVQQVRVYNYRHPLTFITMNDINITYITFDMFQSTIPYILNEARQNTKNRNHRQIECIAIPIFRSSPRTAMHNLI